MRAPSRLRKRLGQHLLIDRSALRRIVDALELAATDTVVEIGPGRGALTDLLLASAGRVHAIELDRDLAAFLRMRYAGEPRCRVIEADVLDLALATAAGTADYVVAGNVPYYITTPILFHALEVPRPRRAVFLVQREVAERVVARPGTKAYGALSVNVQAVATAVMLGTVGAEAFVPRPTVESAILRIDPSPASAVSATEQAAYSAFVIAAFGLRRKQMRRVLRTIRKLDAAAAEARLAEAGIAPDARPEVVSAGEFAALWRATR